MHPLITSLQNSKIKALRALEKARERKRQQRFLIEGAKELTLAVTSGYTLDSVFFCPGIASPNHLRELIGNEDLLIPVSQSVFEKLVYRESTGGVIAIAMQQRHALEGLTLQDNPLVLVVEAVEKPGNLGAMLRTADAAKMDAVIVCDPLTDFYNPNVIRSSLGCVFTNQLAAATTAQAIHWLKERRIHIYSASLQAAIPYTSVDFSGPSAIVLGTESSGLSPVWTKASDRNIIIPMRGKIDSMNVSNAAAILVFEALRQREAKRQ